MLSLAVDAEKERFPFCLVWTPIPVITWFLPFVGHMGVCTSKGVIYDFAGSYHIGEATLAFGSTTRYLQLSPANAEVWDRAVEQANACYSRKMHNLCLQNCHSHCATVLDKAAYAGYTHWNMVILAVWMFFFGRFVSPTAILVSLLPSILLYGALTALLVHFRGGAF